MTARPTALAPRLEVSYMTSHIFNVFVVILEAKFVNPKIVTYVPGPGAHEINDVYTTKEHSKQFWSINRNDRHRQSKPIKHPGP